VSTPPAQTLGGGWPRNALFSVISGGDDKKEHHLDRSPLSGGSSLAAQYRNLPSPEHRMHRIRLLPLAALALVLAFAGTSAKADIVYDLINHSSLQNGYTLSGTITTDGTTGTLTDMSFIKSWAVKITGPSNYKLEFSSSPSVPAELTIGSLVVTETSIKLSTSPNSSFLLGTIGDALVNWNFRGYTAIDYRTERPTGLWSYQSAVYDIATVSTPAVPEPSSLAIAGCGALAGLIALGRNRSRKPAANR
jgi:hypothetical protein